MNDENQGLDPEILDNIESFSGPAPQKELLQSGMALQRVQTQYTTAIAVQTPRSIAKITSNVLAEARLAGASFYYRWPVKSKKGRPSIVQGGSIDLTMCIARNYGNCALEIEVEETLTHYMFKGVFIDLETGFTVPRLFRQRKGQDIGGKYGDERAEDIVFQIGQSKAQRNAIAKAIPSWLIDQAIEEARTAEIAKIKPENIHVARGQAIGYFAKYGVTQEQIESKLDRKADKWTAEDIADLKGMATGVKESRISANELFPAVEEKPVGGVPEKKESAQEKERPITAGLEFDGFNETQGESSPKKLTRRRRTNVYMVNGEKVKTAGVKGPILEQIMKIGADYVQAAKPIIISCLEHHKITELSFLREDEGKELLKVLADQVVPKETADQGDSGPPEEPTVLCPEHEKPVKVSFCQRPCEKADKCQPFLEWQHEEGIDD